MSSFMAVCFYSTFSTNTRIVPPQDRPTFQAVSSATPNSSILGLPLSITSSASVTTAPSTQPPDTEPRKFPFSSMTRLEPTGRGAEPQVSTTVASATALPFLRQSSAALRMSLSVESMSASISRALYTAEYNASRHFLHPGLWVAGAVAAAAERRHQPGHRLQVMDRPEFVDMGQHGLDTAGAGFESLEAQERVEPDEAAARAVQPVDLEGERVVGVALEPVGDEQDDRSLGEHAARPQLVEGVQRRSDARAAGPIRHARRTGRQRIVGVALAQRARDVGQPRAEQERADALSCIGEVVQEMQKDAAILAHRAGDIEQRHDRRWFSLRPDEAQIDEIAAAFHAGAQGAADVDQMAARMRLKPPRAYFGKRQHQALHRLFRRGDLGAGHLREILLLQDFAVGHRHAGVELDLALLLELVVEAGEQRFVHAGGAGLRRLRRPGRRLRQHHRQQLIDIAAAAEENAERLVEQHRMLVPLHEHRVQGPVKIVAGADASGLHRFQRIEHGAGTDRNAGGAQ